MSLFNAASNLGLLAGPLAGAIVMQKLSPSILWLACGLCGMVSIIVLGMLVEPKNR